jgi:thymidylate kinase
MDGSGKSSITKDIINWLDWKIECDYIYIGEGDNYKKPLWYKILQEALPEDNLNGIFKVVYYLLFSFRIKRLLFKCKNYRFRGGIAILDRYPQIQISGLNDGPKITNFIKNIANKSLYKLSLYFSSIEINNLKEANKLIPDIIFKLEVSPETSCKRKKENTIELMTKKHDSFKLITYNAKETISINTELSYEDSLLQIKRIIWKDINKK